MDSGRYGVHISRVGIVLVVVLVIFLILQTHTDSPSYSFDSFLDNIEEQPMEPPSAESIHEMHPNSEEQLWEDPPPSKTVHEPHPNFEEPPELLDFESLEEDTPLCYEEEEEEKKKKDKHGDGHVMPFAVGKMKEKYNIFEGQWVYDPAARPFYKDKDCPYATDQMSCQSFGRPDSTYEHWRWQPDGCTLPSFDAEVFLEALRGKRVLFIGDSLTHGQFRSLLCLVNRAAGHGSAIYTGNPQHVIFKAVEYNATIENFWAPFLVDVEFKVQTGSGGRGEMILHPSSMAQGSDVWKGVDVLVFNSYAWWGGQSIYNVLMSHGEEGMERIVEMQRQDAYRIVLKKMIGWIEENMDPVHTRVFFTGASPTHNKAWEWGGEPYKNCYEERKPITKMGYRGLSIMQDVVNVIKEETSRATMPIGYIDITQLSEYRKEAHTTMYRKFFFDFDPNNPPNPWVDADCLHWCLPGVHDTWNELLFAMLLYPY